MYIGLGRFFKPTDEEVLNAIAEGKKIANYRWGTMWVSESGRGACFAWKLWLPFFIIAIVLMGLLGG